MTPLRAAFRAPVRHSGIGLHVANGVLTLIVVPLLGLLLGLPVWLFELAWGRLDRPLEGLALLPALLTMSPLLAWMGMVPLVGAAPLLVRIGWAGWASFALLGAGIGAVVGMLRELSLSAGATLASDALPMASFLAPFGAVYALTYRVLLTLTASRPERLG